MSKADEYRAFASECVYWARTANSEDERTQFLELDRTWTTAAAQLDQGIDALPPAVFSELLQTARNPGTQDQRGKK